MSTAQALDLPTRPLEARQARRGRAARRRSAAFDIHPDLRIDRLAPIYALLRAFRADEADEAALAAYVAEIREEVAELEARVREIPRRSRGSGETTRRALCFLRTFGRIGALDYSDLPDADRTHLVELLRLEYRWCFAAAGTTPEDFKRSIGRTGAR